MLKSCKLSYEWAPKRFHGLVVCIRLLSYQSIRQESIIPTSFPGWLSLDKASRSLYNYMVRKAKKRMQQVSNKNIRQEWIDASHMGTCPLTLPIVWGWILVGKPSLSYIYMVRKAKKRKKTRGRRLPSWFFALAKNSVS